MAADQPESPPLPETPSTPTPSPSARPKRVRVVNAGPRLIRTANRWARNVGDFSVASVILVAACRIFLAHLEAAFRELAKEYQGIQPQADDEPEESKE